MPGEQQFYSEEEAQQVLHLAARNVPTTGMSREELIRAASEMGITPQAIEYAEAELAAQRQQAIQDREQLLLRKQFGRYYRRRIFDKIMSFVSANAFFVFIWYLTGAGYFWPIWICGWWGIVLLGNILQAILSPDYRERRFEKWLAKQDRSELAEPEGDHEWGRRRRGKRFEKI